MLLRDDTTFMLTSQLPRLCVLALFPYLLPQRAAETRTSVPVSTRSAQTNTMARVIIGDTGNNNDSTDSSEPTDGADPSDSSDPSESTDPSDSIDTTDPADVTDTSDASDTVVDDPSFPDEVSCDAPTLSPLYDDGITLEPDAQTLREDALVTHLADRARDRHAREDIVNGVAFQKYDHYLLLLGTARRKFGNHRPCCRWWRRNHL